MSSHVVCLRLEHCSCSIFSSVFAVFCLGWHVLSSPFVSFLVHLFLAVRWLSAVDIIDVLLRFLLAACSPPGWDYVVVAGVVISSSFCSRLSDWWFL